MKQVKESKTLGLLIFAAIYVLAYAIGLLLTSFVDGMIWRMLLFDISATLIIWAVSLLLKNSSLYDAYWSFTPMVMVIYYVCMHAGELNIYHYTVISAFMLWSVRLTANWIITFDNIMWEDWRYRQYRKLPKVQWHMANLFGIMIIPTVFVFAGLVPLLYYFTLDAGPLSVIGGAVILIGTSFEFFADRCMHRYRKEDESNKACRRGLWRYSRHPNYFGEILIWVGTYVALICTDISYWYLCGGVLIMIFLFNVISIPLAEKRQLERRIDFEEYRKETSRLLPLPQRKNV